MKKTCFLFLLLCSLHSYAQRASKEAPVYFLIDTSRTPANMRMWSISADSQYKKYVIQCPCLNSNGMPTFFYSITDKGAEGKVIGGNELKALKLVNLPALIAKSKQLIDTQLISRVFFFIEPYGKKYIVHNVALINPAAKIVSPPDAIERKTDNSAFELKGLVTVASKDIAKYVNTQVIAIGKVASTKVLENNTILLQVGADYPNQDFTIVIENGNEFDSADVYYTGKQVRVTGKVIYLSGKPAITINNQNQIQWIPPIKVKK